MANNLISEAGIIDQSGKLRLPMDRLNAFYAANKGKRIIATFEAIIGDSTASQLAYYYKYVIPAIQDAFKKLGERKTADDTDCFLVGEYPGNDRGCNEARDFNQQEFSDFLEWLKQYAAENLYVYIEDPKMI